MLEAAPISPTEPVTIRRELREGDLDAIVRMHGRIYGAEYGLGGNFEPDVERALDEAMRQGWPERGGVWIVEQGGDVAGTLALIEEAPTEARLRWFLLDEALRGSGLGRRLLAELVEEADAAGYALIRLETFSELTTAARLYRSIGFELVGSYRDARWGRPLLHQDYERRRA
jgi:ribosomal protein S18 acetylase RimI-like enzyme